MGKSVTELQEMILGGCRYEELYDWARGHDEEGSLPVSSQRRENGLIELHCAHGIGHPAYGSVDFMRRAISDEDGWSLHSCDGCCQGAEWELNDLRTGVETANSIIMQQHDVIQELIETIASMEMEAEQPKIIRP